MKKKIILTLFTAAISALAISGMVAAASNGRNGKKTETIEVNVGTSTISVTREDYDKWLEAEKDVRASFEENGNAEQADAFLEIVKADVFDAYLDKNQLDFSGELSNEDMLALGQLEGRILFDRLSKEPDEKQKEALDKYDEQVVVYPRKLLVELGVIDANTPRITLEAAKNICETYEPDLSLGSEERSYWFSQQFNKISRICDLDGGSGFYRREYWLDDEGTESIVLAGLNVTYHNEKTGETISLR